MQKIKNQCKNRDKRDNTQYFYSDFFFLKSYIQFLCKLCKYSTKNSIYSTQLHQETNLHPERSNNNQYRVTFLQLKTIYNCRPRSNTINKNFKNKTQTTTIKQKKVQNVAEDSLTHETS